MRDRVRRVIAALGRFPFAHADPYRAHAMARLERLEQRVVAILTAAEANRAQKIVRDTGHRRG